jgi:hypothetical protein
MDFLLDFIDFNENVNYELVLYCIGGYILLLWIVVSSWVARDSYKRYGESSMMAAVWFFVVFFLNFPALMFYLVIRPDEHYHNDYFGGGVNVPIANFTGKDGEYLMGIQLKINSAELTEQARDMRLSIDWESDDPDKQVTREALKAEADEVNQKINSFQKLFKNIVQSDTKEKREQDTDKEKKNEGKDSQQSDPKSEEVEGIRNPRLPMVKKTDDLLKTESKSAPESEKDREEKGEKEKKEEKKELSEEEELERIRKKTAESLEKVVNTKEPLKPAEKENKPKKDKPEQKDKKDKKDVKDDEDSQRKKRKKKRRRRR